MKLEKAEVEAISEICKRYEVKSLHVFGSAVKGVLDGSSDVDVIVEFVASSYQGAFDRFMGLKEELEGVFGLPVDLIAGSKFRNPIFQGEVEKTKELIYAA